MDKQDKDILLTVGTFGIACVAAMFAFALLTGAKIAKLAFLTLMLSLTLITLGLSERNQNLLKQRLGID